MLLRLTKSFIIKIILAFFTISLFTTNTSNIAFAGELILYESENCAWCKRWEREVEPVYHTSPEAQILTLRRVNIDEPTPTDLATIYPPTQTPTFVVIEDGREYGRIIGYPGARRFWDMLRVGIARIR